MSELLLDYIEHLEVEGGRSAKTAENYELYLNRFVEFTDDITVDKITSEIIRKYLSLVFVVLVVLLLGLSLWP